MSHIGAAFSGLWVLVSVAVLQPLLHVSCIWVVYGGEVFCVEREGGAKTEEVNDLCWAIVDAF